MRAAQVEREAAILESVAAPFMPDVHGASTVDGWAVLVLEDLSRAHWPPPYDDRGEALLESVRQVAATTPPPGLGAEPEGRPFGTYWQRIADDPRAGAGSRALLGEVARGRPADPSRGGVVSTARR